jgi:hypothetical protein
MKKVILISTFCDTEEKQNILKENVLKVKSMGIDVMAIGPNFIPIKQEIIELCDYFFYTKENPVLDWPIRSMRIWKKTKINGVDHTLVRTYPDYGYAGLTQIKQLSQIALNFDYDQFFHIIYDIKMDKNVIDGLESNKNCNIYPSKRGDVIWRVGLHYMIFNRENLQKFISQISIENYLSLKGSDAFDWLYDIQKVINYTIEPTPVEDEIYFYENFDFFNYSPIDGLKFFIEKNDETLDNIKLFFYDVEKNTDLMVSNGENKSLHRITNNYLIDLGFNKFNIKDVNLFFNNNYYNLTEIIKDIKHNVITSL